MGVGTCGAGCLFMFLHIGDNAAVNKSDAKFFRQQVVQRTVQHPQQVGVLHPQIKQGLRLFQPCCIHQLMRCLAANRLHKSLSSPMYSLTHLFQMRRYKAALRGSLGDMVSRKFRLEHGLPVERGPVDEQLVELLVPPPGARFVGVYQRFRPV